MNPDPTPGRPPETTPPLLDRAPDGRVYLSADVQDLQDALRWTWAAIALMNAPPRVFQHHGRLVQLTQDAEGRPTLQRFTLAQCRTWLAEVGHWTLLRTNKRTGALEPRPAFAEAVLDAIMPPVPVFGGFVHAPIVLGLGRVLDRPGYDAESRLYYAPAPDFVVPPVPLRPTAAEVTAAKALLLDDLLGDFPFSGDAEEAHALACLLLPFVRPLIDGPTPLHVLTSPTPGTGKGLLKDALLFPFLGRLAPSMNLGRDPEETRKRLTAKLQSGAPVLVLDNIQNGHDLAASESLMSALTEMHYEDRRLGQSEMVSLTVRCVWLCTGNNITVDGEAFRRTVRIQIDSGLADPSTRTGFTYPDLRQWARTQRSALVHAALTLIAHWMAEGCPTGTAVLGSFEDWSAVLGGILDACQVGGFLGNRAEARLDVDPEQRAWEALILQWMVTDYKVPQPHTAGELHQMVETHDIEIDLGSGNFRSRQTRLGIALERRRNQRISGYFLRRVGLLDGRTRWGLEPAPVEPEVPEP